jgi:hypothetical protein
MKKVIIKNPLGVQTHRAEMEEPAAWIAECVAVNAWGKPERSVLHKDELMAEEYDDADVLEEEMRELTPAIDAVLDEQGVEVSPAVPAVMQKYVKLKAEYTVEITDLDQDSSWLLEQCHAKRKAEYPSVEELWHAFMDEGQQGLDRLQQVRLAIKAKYPKP